MKKNFCKQKFSILVLRVFKALKLVLKLVHWSLTFSQIEAVSKRRHAALRGIRTMPNI